MSQIKSRTTHCTTPLSLHNALPICPVVVDRDESIRADTTVEALSALRPAFRTDGTVTAGNAPPVNDGAAALVVMSAQRARSEEHTSELQSLAYLVCRVLLEKKNI